MYAVRGNMPDIIFEKKDFCQNEQLSIFHDHQTISHLTFFGELYEILSIRHTTSDYHWFAAKNFDGVLRLGQNGFC